MVFSLSGYNTVQQSVSCEQGGSCSPATVSIAMQKNQSGITLSATQLSVLGFGLLVVGALIAFMVRLAVKRREPKKRV